MSKKLVVIVALLTVFLTSMVMYPAYGEGENILKNPGFEEASGGVPSNWISELFDKDATELKVEGGGHTGSCYSIINNKPNDSKVIQEVTVVPDKVYKVSCWVKAENVKNPAGAANITLENGMGIYTSQEFQNTENTWKLLEFYIKIDKALGDTLNFALRFGGQGTTNEGKVSFDDVSMTLVENPDPSIAVVNFYIPQSGGSSGGGASTSSASGGMGKTVIFIIIGVVVIGGLVFVEMKFSKRGKKEEGEEADAKSGEESETAYTEDTEEDDFDDDDDELDEEEEKKE